MKLLHIYCFAPFVWEVQKGRYELQDVMTALTFYNIFTIRGAFTENGGTHLHSYVHSC